MQRCGANERESGMTTTQGKYIRWFSELGMADVMCEIPNNVIQIDAFAQRFDGFSIGSNDLTQLVLGVDRDSELVAFDFDERDLGVKALIRQTVEGARRNQRHSGICGQAPSDYPEMVEYLAEIGIDSISVTPDMLLQVTRNVLAVEQRLGRAPRREGP